LIKRLLADCLPFWHNCDTIHAGIELCVVDLM
jgi:hypothetical protein